MPKYRVSLTRSETVCSTSYIEIEANNPSEAKTKAEKMARAGLVHWWRRVTKIPKYGVNLTMRETIYATSYIEIEANNPSEAEAKAKKMSYDGLVHWWCKASAGVEIEATEVTQVERKAFTNVEIEATLVKQV